MTAATTLPNKKKNFFSLRFKSKISEAMKLFITNLVFQLLCTPVFAGVLLWETYLENNNIPDRSESIPFIVIAVIAFVLSVFMGLVIPMMNFRYLYNKSLVDMNYSLPLNNRQRFFADFLSGLLVYIAPFIIGAVIGLAELLIGSFFMDIGSIMEYFPIMLKFGTIVIIGLVLLYALSVFAMNFAGSTFEALFSIVAVNIMIPLFIFLTWMNIVEAAHFGLDISSVVNNYTFFTTSPVGVFGFVIAYLDRYSDAIYASAEDMQFETNAYSFVNSMYFNFVVRSLLVIAVIVFITFLLYKHRKAEDVSKPYVYNAFYYIIMSVVTYSILTAMMMTELDSAIVAALIISGIIWFVMEVIRRRGFKRFWTAFIGFAAVSAAVIGVIKIIDYTDGLGRAKYIPSASYVSDVEVDIFGNDFINYDFTLHDQQIIKDAIKLNTEMVDRHYKFGEFEYKLSDYKINQPDGTYSDEELSGYDVDTQEIKIKYYTKSGSAIIRRYYVPSEMLTDICCDICTNKEYAEKETKLIYLQSLRKDGKYGEEYCHYKPDEATYCIFDLTDKLGMSNGLDLTLEEGKELVNAIYKDYAEMTAEDWKNSDYYCNIDSMIINSSCRNTVSFLEEHQVKCQKSKWELFNELDTYSKYITVAPTPEYVFPLLYFKDFNYQNSYSANYFNNYDEFTDECMKLDSILSLGLYRGRGYNYNGNKAHYEFDDPEVVGTLLEAATPVVTGEKVLAEVQIGSVTLYITEKTRNEMIIEKAKDSIKLIDNKTGKEYNPDLYY